MTFLHVHRDMYAYPAFGSNAFSVVKGTVLMPKQTKTLIAKARLLTIKNQLLVVELNFI